MSQAKDVFSFMESMRWDNDRLFLLDQTKIPAEVSYIECRTFQEVAAAIKRMAVRGAPAIGAAAAFGVALAAHRCSQEKRDDAREFLENAARELAATRPTAVNLFWALRRMEKIIGSCSGPGEFYPRILHEALEILREDVETNREIGRLGAELIPAGASVLTHCNAGALATGGYGTALGMIRYAHDTGKNIRVFADETRPLLQGARLTAFELMTDKIPVTLITDNMAGFVMKKGLIDLVVVGADRITSQGDVANKIGTYGVAVLAKAHGIPFYVAAPVSTFDLTLCSCDEIPIEERDPAEVREVFGVKVSPAEVPVLNPAFDVTPHELISAIITERGIIENPNAENVGRVIGRINETDIPSAPLR